MVVEAVGTVVVVVVVGGAVYGVAVAVVDVLPVPAAFTAATRNTYSTPLVNPVTVAETDPCPANAVAQLAPASLETSTS